MPTPRPAETEKDFVARCVPVVLRDGTAKDDKQAVAVCHSLYKESKMSKIAQAFEVKGLKAQADTELVDARNLLGRVLDALEQIQEDLDEASRTSRNAQAAYSLAEKLGMKLSDADATMSKLIDLVKRAEAEAR